MDGDRRKPEEGGKGQFILDWIVDSPSVCFFKVGGREWTQERNLLKSQKEGQNNESLKKDYSLLF